VTRNKKKKQTKIKQNKFNEEISLSVEIVTGFFLYIYTGKCYYFLTVKNLMSKRCGQVPPQKKIQKY
jgi:hypothetical protein